MIGLSFTGLNTPHVHKMEENTVIAITITCVFLILFANCACTVLEATSDPPELPLLPTTAQQLQAEDASDGCSPTDVSPPMYTQGEGRYFLALPSPAVAQDEGGNILALPSPAVTQDEGGHTLVLPPPAVTQDERGNTLVLPPLAVTQDKYGYNSGIPHLQSSTLLPVYMDGSDGALSK